MTQRTRRPAQPRKPEVPNSESSPAPEVENPFKEDEVPVEEQNATREETKVPGEEAPQDTTEVGKQLVLVGAAQQDTKDEKSGKAKRAYVVTPFQICKAVNATLAAAGINKVLPPQMLYSYRRQGKFESSIATDGTGRIVVDRESFEIWFASYLVGLQKRLRRFQATA